MIRDKNIFHNVIRDENTMTEILCNLLQFPSFMRFFANLIKERLNLNYLHFDYQDICTQKNLGRYGIPDILIETGELALMVEVKTGNSRLTASQPEGYFKYLQRKEIHNKSKLLIFLIPECYEFEEELNLRANRIRNSANNINFTFGKIYWEDLYANLQRSEIAKSNLVLRHFTSRVKRMFGNVVFTIKEVDMLFDKKLATSLQKIIDLVYTVKEKVEKSRDIGGRQSAGFEEFGFCARSIRRRSDKDIVYFGIWLETWKQGYPFVIGISTEVEQRIKNKLSRRLQGRSFLYKDEHPNWLFYEVPKEYIKRDTNGRDIAALIVEIANDIDKRSNNR